MTCKDCLHCEVCYIREMLYMNASKTHWMTCDDCLHFKDRTKWFEFPLKIGEKCYCITTDNNLIEDVVEDYDIWSIKDGVKLRIRLLNNNDYVVGEYSKTVFRTREEAIEAWNRRAT